MSTLTTALFLIVVLEATYGFDHLAAIRDKVVLQRGERIKSRQSNKCSIPTSFPEQCETAFAEADAILDITRLGELDLAKLNAILDTVCTDKCVGPEIEFYQCLGEEDLADFVNNGLCGESNGMNCLVLWLDGIINNSIVDQTACALSGSCDSECRGSLQSTASYLGCCAASLYNNPDSEFAPLIPPQQFATCDVDIGQPCPDAVAGAGVNRVGLGLLTVFAAVVAVVNLITFSSER